MIALFVSVCLNIGLFCVAFGYAAELSAAKLRIKRETARVETWQKTADDWKRLCDDWRELCDKWRGHAASSLLRSLRTGAPVTWTVDAIEKVQN